MRLNNKYKIYSQLGVIPENFHSRILKFKRPKWKKFQKNLLSQNLSPMKGILNNFCVKSNFKIWDKTKSYYKQGVKSRNVLYNLFDKSVTIKDLSKPLKFSKNLDNRDIILSTLFKPEYRLDILLWRLSFFNSSYHARQAINNGLVLVNGKKVSGNLIVKKGYIVSFSNKFNIKTLDVLKNSNLFSINKNIISFVEVDYYTNSIIITKNIEDISLEDIYLLKSTSYDLKKIKDFI